MNANTAGSFAPMRLRKTKLSTPFTSARPICPITYRPTDWKICSAMEANRARWTSAPSGRARP